MPSISAVAACSAAVWTEGRIAGARFAAMASGQSEALVPMAVEAMAEARVSFDRLARIAVTVGPGAFTGLRIGLAAARGLGLAAAVPVVGVTTFAALAAGVSAAERAGRRLLVAIDTKRAGDLYLQLFDPGLAPLGAPACLPFAEIAGLAAGELLLLAGDGALKAAEALGTAARASIAQGSSLPDAAVVARLVAGMVERGEADSLLPPRPLYLRAADARLPARPPGRAR